MKYPCIAIDVSRESSHIQGFYELDQEASDPIRITHDNLGFNELTNLIKSIYSRTSKEVIVVFEDTGVYDKPLQMFLADHSIRYPTINPLLSARYRNKAFGLLKQIGRTVQT